VPTICLFYGIAIQMFWRDYPPPHFHVLYQDWEAQVALDGTVIAGSLPPRILAMVREWASLNQTALSEAWEATSSGRAPQRIRPLA
jgi:hypothetical protein